MVVLRNLYQSTRALLNRKLGTCPKCMASSIVGSGLSWLALAILYAMWPNRLALAFTLTVAVAFTVLMITHVVVHMFRVAPAVRVLPLNRRGELDESQVGHQKSRREFGVAVARAGLSFATAAVVSLPLLNRRAEAKGGSTFALYCLGQNCAQQATGGGLPVACVGLGLAYGTHVNIQCGRTAPTSMICSNSGCTPLVLELLSSSTTCGTATAGVSTLSLKGYKCTACTATNPC